MAAEVDPITLQVLIRGLQSIADEMVAALVRTAYSTNIKDRRDCSAALYSMDGEVVTQCELGTPLHLGTMSPTVRTALQAYPASSLRAGDAVILNTPYPAGPGHLNDIGMLSPVVWEGEVVALVANTAHHVDVGGFAPGSMPFGVSEIYQEGLQIPPVRLFKEGALDDELFRLISQNVRTDKEFRGDILAQAGANHVGVKRFGHLLERYGPELLRRYFDAIQDHAERRMRAGIAALPDGRYEFEDVIEGDSLSDRLITLRVAVIIEGERLRVDFSGTDAQVEGPINCFPPSVFACVAYAMKLLVDPELPPCAGTYRPLEVVVPQGSLLNARYPAAVCNANIITTQRLVDIMLGAMAQAVPERVSAACTGSMNLLTIGGSDGHGERFNYIETYGGGQGAFGDKDGMSGVHTHMTNTRNASVESIEQAYPLLVERYGLVPGSGGPGRQRGGLGMVRALRLLGKEATVTVSMDRLRRQPWGLDGGGGGRCGSARLEKADGTCRELSSKVTLKINEGDCMIITTAGGGGWGDPRRRPASAVAMDVALGLVSAQQAREEYGIEAAQAAPARREVDGPSQRTFKE